ncbi:hypothetical protein Halha_0950 [Halobacteroides halobius DSM 5150]|uniref:Uncharacterized protein n=1 Tax=Halobacteroides halobius (strain ATCC 35273 / DSM 5150 / MD-1) TaxID=748449 RepID=L0K7D1_HALHC|nr:hypothetical protein [Halobacteroides halobius]AGB40911.1 hypothetical protein Halha_0950 [Halobacteroides halobius DSM 5150]
MKLTTQVIEFAKEQGADLVGIVDLEETTIQDLVDKVNQVDKDLNWIGDKMSKVGSPVDNSNTDKRRK